MSLRSMGIVPLPNGYYKGKITGDYVDTQVVVENDIIVNLSFLVDEGVIGEDVPVFVHVKDNQAEVYLDKGANIESVR